MSERNGERRTFPLVPIQQRDVYSNVIHRLSALLESGQYAPGDRLPSERALADMLQVSRVAVREAMKVLQSMGKVEIRHGAGTFVLHPERNALTSALLADQSIDLSFLAHLIDVRAAIEMKVVALVIERATDAEIEEITALLKQNEAEYFANAELGSLNVQFEAALGQATHNPVLIALQQAIHQAWIFAWGQLSLAPDSKYVLHQEHLAILDAIRRRDHSAALQAMQHHVDRQLNPRLEASKDQPVYQDEAQSGSSIDIR